MTTHLVHGGDFTALTVADARGATLMVERTDDGRLSAWIAPPGCSDGHSVQIDETDLIALVAYMSADTQGALVSAADLAEAKAAAKQWHEKYANAQQALRSVTQAKADDAASTDRTTKQDGHRPAYVALVCALRAEFEPAALEALWIQLRQHRDNRSSLGLLAQAVHDAQDVTYDAGEEAHPAVRAWLARNAPSGTEATV